MPTPDETNDGRPFLQLVKRCECHRQLSIRASLRWVNWMRSMTKETGSEFSGAAFSHYCSGCRRTTYIDAGDLYLNGVLVEEAS